MRRHLDGERWPADGTSAPVMRRNKLIPWELKEKAGTCKWGFFEASGLFGVFIRSFVNGDRSCWRSMAAWGRAGRSGAVQGAPGSAFHGPHGVKRQKGFHVTAQVVSGEMQRLCPLPRRPLKPQAMAPHGPWPRLSQAMPEPGRAAGWTALWEGRLLPVGPAQCGDSADRG